MYSLLPTPYILTTYALQPTTYLTQSSTLSPSTPTPPVRIEPRLFTYLTTFLVTPQHACRKWLRPGILSPACAVKPREPLVLVEVWTRAPSSSRPGQITLSSHPLPSFTDVSTRPTAVQRTLVLPPGKLGGCHSIQQFKTPNKGSLVSPPRLRSLSSVSTTREASQIW